MQRLLSRGNYRELFVNVGKIYRRALAGYELLLADDLELRVAVGSSGRRQAMLRDWLRHSPPPQLSISTPGNARIRGIEVALTPEEVVDIACRALADDKDDPNAYQSWYVPIKGQRVAPKWLISQLTGLPVRSFVTDEARRVLVQLGIAVKRI
ncbi:MAG: hypothetical protein L0226_05720 [Acidobacteria bacterium]|nr:hypothetical protein [Acidobacteriota bacterium]